MCRLFHQHKTALSSWLALQAQLQGSYPSTYHMQAVERIGELESAAAALAQGEVQAQKTLSVVSPFTLSWLRGLKDHLRR